MDQGDFIVQFMDLCEPELEKNISDILPTKLENLLGNYIAYTPRRDWGAISGTIVALLLHYHLVRLFVCSPAA